MSEKIEAFYHSVYKELSSKLGDCIYKEINVVPLVIKFYLNTIINSKTFIQRIDKTATEKQMQSLIEEYFEAFFKPKTNKLKLAATDVLRYAYHKLFSTSQKSDADFFVFITNKKFYSFIKPIKEELEKQGKKVEFLLWDKNNTGSKEKEHFPKPTLPSFTKGYFQYYNFTSLIDRANGFLPLLKNKKVILIEGDLEAHHILGLLGKKNNFETYCLQWGFFGKTATKSGWREMPFDKLLVWGDFFAENFKPYNHQLQIVSVGHPSLQDNVAGDKKHQILFAVQKEFGEHITKQDVLNFIRFGANTASQMPNYTIVLRSHPDFEIPEDIKKEYSHFSNIIWHDYKNFSLNQSFEDTKYCVSISSTVSLESIAYGCYPVYLKINNLPLQIHQILAQNSESQHVFDTSDFVAGIKQLETQNLKNNLADFKAKLYKYLGTDAIKATVSEMN